MEQSSQLSEQDAHTAAKAANDLAHDRESIINACMDVLAKAAIVNDAPLPALVERLAGERDRLSVLVGAETPIAAFDLATTWRTEKAALQQECAELRASAEIAVARWKRSEAIRKAAIDQVCDQGLHIEELERELSALRAAQLATQGGAE